MEITIYAKKRTMQDGKSFYSYLTTLPRKDGTKQTVAVKFRDEAGHPKPENCPMNVVVEKQNANIARKEYTTENGETGISYTLWVSEWKQGAPYVDTSLDEFDL